MKSEAISAVAICLFCCGVSAEDLFGTVTDALSGDPVSGVTITIVGRGTAQTTDGNGNYTFTGLDDGTYTVRAEARGYYAMEREVNLGASVFGDRMVAGLVPVKAGAVYNRGAGAIRVSAGTNGGKAVFALSGPDGRTLMRRNVSGGFVSIPASDFAAGKYLWTISREKTETAHGTLEITR